MSLKGLRRTTMVLAGKPVRYTRVPIKAALWRAVEKRSLPPREPGGADVAEPMAQALRFPTPLRAVRAAD
eukprot:3864040-Alexandrium_andersonii.AAC.1